MDQQQGQLKEIQTELNSLSSNANTHFLATDFSHLKVYYYYFSGYFDNNMYFNDYFRLNMSINNKCYVNYKEYIKTLECDYQYYVT